MVQALFLSETALGTGSNLFARADLVRKVHGFDESFRRHQDVEFGVRLFSLCPVYRIREIQIVKEMDGFSNALDYERFRAAKEQFARKFEKEIQVLGEEDAKRFYAGQWRSLLYTACSEGKKENIRTAAAQLRKYRTPGLKECVLLILCKIHMFPVYEALKRFLKLRKCGKIYNQVTENLASYDRNKFDEMLGK